MLDTASNQNVVSKSFCEQHNLLITPCISVAKSFNNDLINSTGTISINLDFGMFELKNVIFYVYESAAYPILLQGSLFKSIEINYSDNNEKAIGICLNGFLVPAFFGEGIQLCAQTTLTVPAKSFKVFELNSTAVPKDLSYVCYPTVETLAFKELTVSPVICKNSIFYLAVENRAIFDIDIPRNLPLYNAVPESTVNALLHVTDEESETKRHEEHQKWRIEKFKSDTIVPDIPFGPQITDHPDRLVQFQSLINSKKMAFSAEPMDIGLIRNYRYYVKLKENARIWFQPPRRVSPCAQQEINKVFQGECQNKLLEEGPSQYGVPLVLVRKSNGKYRICMDLRECNKEIIMDKFPLGDIPSIVNNISMAIAESKDQEIFISKFDLNQAYRQLSIAKEDQDKFAFCSGGKQFRNLRMTFGSSDAPGSFSQLVGIIFKELPNALPYLDDIINISVGYENCLKDTAKFLDICTQNGITLNAPKCCIGALELDILGFRLNPKGIGLNPNKVDKLLQLEPPRNKDQVRSVLGSFNFYRDHCPRLITTLAPLFNLVRKNVKFRWESNAQNAFLKAKDILANYVQKCHRDPKLPLVLCCDASQVGAGAVLSQRRADGVLEPLGYYSRNFTPTEQRCPIRTRELFAIFYGIKYFEGHLLTEDFFVHSDHRSLEFFRNTKTNVLSTRAYNIIHYLNRFRFKLIYIPGKDERMLNADLMSRAPYFAQNNNEVDDDDLDHDEIRVFSVNSTIKQFPFTYKFLKECQDNDPSLQKIILSPKEPYFVCSSGLLNRKLKDRSVIVLPKELTSEIVTYCHMRRGHLAFGKLHHFMRLYFSASNLRFECKRVSANCGDCHAVRYTKPLPTYGPKLCDVDDEPFKKAFIDVIDFGQLCKNGYRYCMSYMCELTKYLDLVPMPDKTPSSISKAIMIMVTRYGIPERLTGDNGMEFRCHVTQNVLDSLGIYYSSISPHRPGGNKVERAHKNIGQLLKLYEVPAEKWSEQIHILTFFYNTTPMETLKNLSPFECLFLRHPRPPFEHKVKTKIQAKWIELFGHSATDIFTEIACIHRQRFNARKIGLTDAPPLLKRHQHVLVFKPLAPGNSKKLSRKWQGPYAVVKRCHRDVYLLRHLMTSRRLKRHIEHIRPIPKDVIYDQNKNPDKVSDDLILETEFNPVHDAAIVSNTDVTVPQTTLPEKATPAQSEISQATRPERATPAQSEISRATPVPPPRFSLRSHFDSLPTVDTNTKQPTRPPRQRKIPARYRD